MLAVIEQQQQLPLAKRLSEPARKIRAIGQLKIQRCGDQSRQRALITGSGEIDPVDRIGLLTFTTAGELQCQLCLSRASGARERDQARRRGNEFELCEIFVPAYELDTSLRRCGAAQREFPHPRYRRYPAISLRVDGFDEARFQRIVAEQSPQLRDEPRQGSGSDDDPTPDLRRVAYRARPASRCSAAAPRAPSSPLVLRAIRRHDVPGARPEAQTGIHRTRKWRRELKVAGSCASARPNPDQPAAVQEAIPGWEIKVRDDRTS